MYQGLSEDYIDRFLLLSWVIALLAATINLAGNTYPILMMVDSSAALLLLSIWLNRKRISKDAKIGVIVAMGSLIGLVSLLAGPAMGDGLVVLASVMVLTYAQWTGWKPLLVPVLIILVFFFIALGLGLGLIHLSPSHELDVNQPGFWLIMGLVLCLLAAVIGGSTKDFKQQIGERIQALEIANSKLFNAAYTDPITQVPNQQQFEQVLQGDIQAKVPGVFILVDVADFRLINALHGHSQADKILLHLARALTTWAGTKYHLARFPGDQFGLWLKNTDPRLGQEYCTEVLNFCSKGLSKILPTLQLRAAWVPNGDPGKPFSKILMEGNLALSKAKQGKPGTIMGYSQDLEDQFRTKQVLTKEVISAMDQGAFYPVYQAKVDPRTLEIVALEGLARLDTAMGRQGTSPQDFIPILHQEGLMPRFSTHMIQRIFSDLPLLQAQYGPSISVASNISPPVFLASDFVSTMADILAKTKVDPSHCILEITEDVFIEDTSTLLKTFGELRSMGFGIALDDFGSGYSSLGYLRKLHFDEIKIDKSFLDTRQDLPQNHVVLRSMCNLAKDLGARVVVEGIETKEQLGLIQDLHVDLVQGFLFSRPQPMDSLVLLLNKDTVETHFKV